MSTRSPLLKDLLLVAALFLVTPSLAGSVQGQTRRSLRQDSRRTNKQNRGPDPRGGKGDQAGFSGLFDKHAQVDTTPQYDYTDVQVEYFAFCEAELLSDDVIGDGLISQSDFANTLADLCDKFMVGTIAGFQCPQPRFSSLDVKLQLIFAFGVCRDDDPMVTQMQCLRGLKDVDGMGMEIGYMVTPETRPVVEMDVRQLCFRLFPFVFRKFPVCRVEGRYQSCCQLSQFLTLFFAFRRTTN
jgi:hypothetical protein